MTDEQSTGISVKIELQVGDVKRLENNEALAFGDVEITMSAAAARYLYTKNTDR